MRTNRKCASVRMQSSSVHVSLSASGIRCGVEAIQSNLPHRMHPAPTCEAKGSSTQQPGGGAAWLLNLPLRLPVSIARLGMGPQFLQKE